MAKKNPVGRPTKYNKDFHCDDFIRLSKQGKTLTQISLEWDVDRDTILEWKKKHKEFSGAVKKGRQFSEAWYTNLGQLAMMDQATSKDKFGTVTKLNVNLGFFVWMTKNLFKWSDKLEQEIEMNENVVYNIAWADEEDEADSHSKTSKQNASATKNSKKSEKI